jgi:hypothetical protein
MLGLVILSAGPASWHAPAQGAWRIGVSTHDCGRAENTLIRCRARSGWFSRPSIGGFPAFSHMTDSVARKAAVASRIEHAHELLARRSNLGKRRRHGKWEIVRGICRIRFQPCLNKHWRAAIAHRDRGFRFPLHDDAAGGSD